MTDTKREAPASLEKRAAALEIVLRRKADMPKSFVAEFTEHADDAWITANGAQMVARAWTDPEYRARMLVDGLRNRRYVVTNQIEMLRRPLGFEPKAR